MYQKKEKRLNKKLTGKVSVDLSNTNKKDPPPPPQKIFEGYTIDRKKKRKVNQKK
jgi:hypothetical protein